MMVRISGCRPAAIHPPKVYFKNVKRSYPVRGAEKSFPGACYRESPKEWMDGVVWNQWLTDPREISALPAGI